MERNLTTGSVAKNLIFFSLPYLLSYFLQTLYGMADLFIIGQYEGVASTTAVSVGSQVMHMLTVMIVGLAMGTTVSIGQAVGAGDKRKTSHFIGNTVTLFMAVSVTLTIVLLLLVDPIVSVMSTPAQAVSGTAAYLTVCFIGIPFITAYNIISSVFRGMGDSKTPMYFIAIACIVNIALDYLFMGAMHLGPTGAALGTTLSQAVSVTVALVSIRKKHSITLERSDLKPSRAEMSKLLSIGVPVAMQDGLIQVAFIIITIIANRRGLNDAAAVGIVEKIMSFLFLVPSSMLSAVSALGAQNIGANKPERAIRTLHYAIIITVSFGLVVAVSTQFVADRIVALFTDDAKAIRLGGQYFLGLYLGLHVCGHPLQLQWLFLRHRQIGDIVFAQHSCGHARACPGCILHLEALSDDAVPHGLGDCWRLTAVRCRVPHSLCNTQTQVGRSGGLEWTERSYFPSARCQSCFTSA